MITAEAMERDEERAERDKEQAEKASIGSMVSLEDGLPPLSTAPAIIEGSQKRAQKHTTTYREAFGDSQENPTARIKRGKSGGIL
ncbi:hypothetical protein GJ744_005652 [Endocarpon pusillum]|uniref:Uncharacterized protein n=1 Tax=Endocarpon pusillum TaxID=364733 RepID=A0A8H7DYL4_9EURO|nr:hypothetical protein GJ744_005652 [Endocarpon pusillum]